MGETGLAESSTVPARAWVRRRRSCRADYLSAVFAQGEMATGAWSCPPAAAVGAAIGACAFRRAAASAHEQSNAGVRLRFKGLAADEEPGADIGVGAGYATLPGGVVRVAPGDSTVHGFATTLPAPPLPRGPWRRRQHQRRRTRDVDA